MSLVGLDPWLWDNYADFGNNLPCHLVTCWRFHEGPEYEDNRYTRLHSLECLQVQYYLGARPPTARFRYRFGDGNPLSPPTWESALSADYRGVYPHGINAGDRLLVIVSMVGELVAPDNDHDEPTPGPTEVILFDGYAISFEGAIKDGAENVHILAAGTCKRFDDKPIVRTIWRHSDDAYNPEANIPLPVPAVFNERGLPNASPDDPTADREGGPDGFTGRHAVFMDWNGGSLPSFWTLARAVGHLLYADPDPTLADLDFRFPSRVTLQNILKGQLRVSDEVSVDPDDPSTYIEHDIQAPNTPILGRRIAPTIEAMVGDKGFWVRWTLVTERSPEGWLTPRWEFEIGRTQAGPVKFLYLQPRYTPLDQAFSNACELSFVRDLSNAYNTWVVRGGRTRYESAYVLEPGFETNAGDDDDPELFNRSHPDFAGRVNDYRLWVFGESGSLHWPLGSGGVPGSTPADALDPVFGEGQYVRRGRPPLGQLVTTDAGYRPLRPKLFYSTRFAGTSPCVWDGTDPDQWKEVPGGFEVLQDRLGVWISSESLELQVGHDEEGAPVVLNILESAVNGNVDTAEPPTDPAPRFHFMLVCAVEGDDCVTGTAERISSAPLREQMIQLVDASDRYSKRIIKKDSYFGVKGPIPGETVPLSEDWVAGAGDELEWEAESLRDAAMNGVLEGPITLGRFTTYYRVGDRIRGIWGRGLDLRTDGDPSSAGAVCPVVTSVTYKLDGPQQTILHLSDSVTSRKSYRAKDRPPRQPTRSRH